MKINVEVTEVTLDSIVAEHMVQTGEDDYRGEPVTLREVVVKEIARQALAREQLEGWQSLSSVIKDVRAELLRELLLPKLTEALATPLTPTDGYGQPKGAQTTLTEIITKEFRDVLAERVDDRGATGYMSRDKSWTRLEWMIRSAVQATVAKELGDELAAAKEQLRATLQQVAAAKLAEAVPVR